MNGLPRRRPLLAATAAAGVVMVLAGVVVLSPGRDERPPARAPWSSAPSLVVRPAGAAVQTSTPVAQPTTRPTPPATRLPALLGAIGDSLTEAFDTGNAFGPAPQHSWVVGTDPADGVESHLERLRALGADPAVVDAARPGMPMAAAPDQARLIVARAATLPAGETAYVTFELGANDLCRPTLTDATSVPDYTIAATEAFAILGRRLPAHSVVLVLSVPDVPRLREVFADEPAVLDAYRQYAACPPALGDATDVAAARDRIAAYNGVLGELCAGLRAARLDCRFDLAIDPARSLFGAPFGPGAISRIDHFHPSVLGQARIAEVSWSLTPWGSVAPSP